MLLRRQVDEERDEHIDMTPMVDVVFQLMTFMLFASQMTGGEKVEIPPARHGVGVEEDAATFVTVMPSKTGSEALMFLGNGPKFRDDESPDTVTLDQVRKAIAEGVKEGRRKVVLQADGEVSHGEVLKLISAISDTEGITIHVGVQEPQ
jgi:biopolymer transport protein TolR